MRIPLVNCQHWTRHNTKPAAGECATGFKLNPSPGVCEACPARVARDVDAPALDAPWPPGPDADEIPVSPAVEAIIEKSAAAPVFKPGVGVVREHRPRPTLSMVKAWTVAATMGRYVAAEEVARRNEICAACPMLRADKKGNWCGACGCSVSSDASRLMNLAAYVENMEGLPGFNPAWPSWGCKHPQRGLTVIQPGGESTRLGWDIRAPDQATSL